MSHKERMKKKEDSVSFFRKGETPDEQAEEQEEILNSGSWMREEKKVGIARKACQLFGAVFMAEILPKVYSGYKAPLKESAVPRFVNSSIPPEKVPKIPKGYPNVL